MSLEKAFKRTAARADLPSRYSIHCLRHTYACELYKASGYNLRLVQKQLGHSQIATTQVYADVVEPDMQRALERLYNPAARRENPMVTQYFIDDHPTILRLIELVVEESGDTPVSLCGELAGRIDVMSSVLRTGLRSLSVPASLVPDVRNAIRNLGSNDLVVRMNEGSRI